jgi:hypothetical protein
MSTNNYPDDLPDLTALEKLANQFFSALPGTFPEGLNTQQFAQQSFNPDSAQQYGNLGLGNIPVDLPGAGSLVWAVFHLLLQAVVYRHLP